MNSVHLVNRVDKLTLEYIDRHCLLPYADYNHLMNSFVLRIIFCNGNNKSIAKVTLQLFLSRGSAMCFTCNFTINLVYELFYLLNTKYGIKVKTCSLCTSVWSYHLLWRIGELSKFYGYLIKRFSTVEYEPVASSIKQSQSQIAELRLLCDLEKISSYKAVASQSQIANDSSLTNDGLSKQTKVFS